MEVNGCCLRLFLWQFILTIYVPHAYGISRKNEDPGILMYKEMKEMVSSQALLQQDVQSLRKEIVQLSDLVRNQIPNDCYSAKLQGAWNNVEEIKPPGLPVRRVLCDQFTSDGGWTVVVSRNSEHYFKLKNGSASTKRKETFESTHFMNSQKFVNFNRTWNEYKIGFGDPQHEYWIGNEVLHALTRERPWEALVVLEDWNGNVAYGTWDSFRVFDEDSYYRLETSRFRKDKSNVGDGLSYHSGSAFSTFDQDNDEYDVHCALKYGGGWWFHQCHVSYLTGTHLSPGKEGHHAVHWLPWKNSIKSLKKASLMIRPPVPK